VKVVPYHVSLKALKSIEARHQHEITDSSLNGFVRDYFSRASLKLSQMLFALQSHDLNGYIQWAAGDLHYQGGLKTDAPQTPQLLWKVPCPSWHCCIGGLTTGMPQVSGIFQDALWESCLPLIVGAGWKLCDRSELTALGRYFQRLALKKEEKYQISRALEHAFLALGVIDPKHFVVSRLFNNETLGLYHSRAFSSEDMARLRLAQLEILSALPRNSFLVQQMQKNSRLGSSNAYFEKWYLTEEFKKPDKMIYFVHRYREGMLKEIRWHKKKKLTIPKLYQQN